MGYLNEYLYRGTKPKPLPRPGPKRISTPAGERLSTILETNNNNTTSNANSRPKPLNRSLAQRLHLGTPPRASFEKRPPSYATQDGALERDVEAPSDSHPGWVQRNISGRGGWKRLALIVALVLAVIIALAVGLGVGLSKNSDSNGDNGKSGSPQPQPFPAGAWNFNSYLMNISTACAPSADLWTCHPYTTYSSTDPSTSQEQYSWIIKESPSSSSQFVISSSANPLSITFKNAQLTLRNENTANEHYFFSLSGLSKQVWAQNSLTGQNNRTACYYNNTILQASLYTRKPATLSPQSGSSMANVGASSGPIFKDWPHAVQIEEIAHGGSNEPSCYATYNTQPVGDPIPLSTMPANTMCQCSYNNFNSGGS